MFSTSFSSSSSSSRSSTSFVGRDATSHVAFQIQAHPSRIRLVEDLRRQIPLAGITWDESGPWVGFQRALSSISDSAQHLCVVQDDVTLCRSFQPAVERIAELQSESLVVLFLGGVKNTLSKEFLAAEAAGERFAELHPRNSIDYVHVVATLWPRALLSDFQEWAKIANAHDPRSDDAYVSKWARETRPPIVATIPSLVEHLDIVPSTIGLRAQAGANKKRVALRFIGDADPLEVFR